MLHGKGHAEAITSTEALIANAEHYERVSLAQHGTNQHSEPEGEDVTTSPPPERGNGQAYLLRRLARDAPEVLERVKAGEFRSARAAAIEAGIINANLNDEEPYCQDRQGLTSLLNSPRECIVSTSPKLSID